MYKEIHGERERERGKRRERGSQTQMGRLSRMDRGKAGLQLVLEATRGQSWVLQEEGRRRLLSTGSHLRTVPRNLFHFNILQS